VLVRHQCAKARAARLPERRCCQVRHATRPLGQPRAKLREQLIHGLHVPIGRRFWPGAELPARKVAQGCRMPRQIERLCANPWPEYRLCCARAPWRAAASEDGGWWRRR